MRRTTRDLFTWNDRLSAAQHDAQQAGFTFTRSRDPITRLVTIRTVGGTVIAKDMTDEQEMAWLRTPQPYGNRLDNPDQ